MARAFVALGSNLGDRPGMISQAVQRLSQAPAVRLVQMAPIYETAPLGGPPQPDFLNSVVELETACSPHELLALLKRIEREMGRDPSGTRWGPRTIDLDLLLYDELILDDARLTLPHPRMHERAFVLQPLAELAPELIHPRLQRRVEQLLEALRQPSQRHAADP